MSTVPSTGEVVTNGFEYLRNANDYYRARTPMAALKAVESGLLPPAAYIYRTNSVKPLNEEPIDLPEVERVLSRPDNDLNTNLLLISILEKLLGNSDPEIALFAAESINTIENRYNARIEGYKKELSGDRPGDARRGIAAQFFELARINEQRPAIRRFYLVESYSYLRELFRHAGFTKQDVILTVDVLLELDLPDRARFILERVQDNAEPWLLFLKAKVEFKDKRFDRVAELMSRLRGRASRIDEVGRELVGFWQEGPDAG